MDFERFLTRNNLVLNTDPMSYVVMATALNGTKDKPVHIQVAPNCKSEEREYFYVLGNVLFPSNQQRQLQVMDFSSALAALKHGKRLTRAIWNGRDTHVSIQSPHDGSEMSSPYFYLSQGRVTFPWTPLQEDLMANDWLIED
jgi:hypothetical protein